MACVPFTFYISSLTMAFPHWGYSQTSGWLRLSETYFYGRVDLLSQTVNLFLKRSQIHCNPFHVILLFLKLLLRLRWSKWASMWHVYIYICHPICHHHWHTTHLSSTVTIPISMNPAKRDRCTLYTNEEKIKIWSWTYSIRWIGRTLWTLTLLSSENQCLLLQCPSCELFK